MKEETTVLQTRHTQLLADLRVEVEEQSFVVTSINTRDLRVTTPGSSLSFLRNIHGSGALRHRQLLHRFHRLLDQAGISVYLNSIPLPLLGRKSPAIMQFFLRRLTEK